MSELEVIIGLEVHAQMNTKTKLFCACDNDAFGKPPNSTVCPICMGHPGTLPVPNAEAIKKAMKAAAALKCSLLKENHLDRKNYFYPDLPMGYQISQYDFPLAKKGSLSYGEGKVCGITRLHIENDAGKLMHAGGRSYCDFNRAGTPLMEIVTEPDLRNSEEAMTFAKELQKILIAVDASEADMYKGMMRFDASISLRPKGEKKLYPRSEIKNLNSFKALGRALLFEEARLRALWEKNDPPTSEVTVHWDDEKGEGRIMRQKESAADYRYFPEPDIPPLSFDAKVIAEAAKSFGELPEAKKERYQKEGLLEDQATLLAGDPKLSQYFDAVASSINDPKRAASIVLSQLLGFLKAAEKSFAEGPKAEEVIALLRDIDSQKITSNAGKTVLEKMVESGKEAATIIKEEGLGQIADTSTLEKIVKKAIEENPKAVEDIRNGKEKAKAAIVGFVMKETKGQANPALIHEIIQKVLFS
ncbi:MAG TPA: Asp-tRNA(Asn)/Glu-tRNA(Gln) amidotransferase subunit GatB [Candidatus Peribacterales bacterium]|nr:Asp-tRNA(Asn)/Glu-tRNA(Gln) amidotransferase subunit GatB [Candidatus Peribacterales bacterium]